MSEGVDSGDYRWHDEYAQGGALTDVPRNYDVRTLAQIKSEELAQVEEHIHAQTVFYDQQLEQLIERVAKCEMLIEQLTGLTRRLAEQVRDMVRMSQDDGR